MIVPLALGAAALLLLAKGAADSHRHNLTKRFSKTTLVTSSEEGVYDTVTSVNGVPASSMTKTLTHILNAAFQNGMNVYTTHDGGKVTFDVSGESARRHWVSRGFELYLSPKDIKLMPGKKHA